MPKLDRYSRRNLVRTRQQEIVSTVKAYNREFLLYAAKDNKHYPLLVTSVYQSYASCTAGTIWLGLVPA